MIKRKVELLDYISNTLSNFDMAVQSAPELLEESAKKIIASGKEVKKQISDGELLIPIVGGFSAGKSTGINNFLEKEVLPVAITAETSIPSEIRYSTEERVVAHTKNGDVEEYLISDLISITEKAEKFTLLQIYVNSESLKRIEPFVLVDMPGFDSTLQQHNDAILRYLASGAYYLFFINSSDGTIKSSDLRRLVEINESEKDFYVVLSKSDLLPPSRLEEIKIHVNQLIDDHIGVDQKIYTLGFDDVSAISSVINASDPEGVFNDQYINDVKGFYYDISSSLNSVVSALEKSGQEKEEELKSLKKVLDDVLDQKKTKIDEIQEKSTNSYENQILGGIEKDLKGAVGELVSVAKQGDETLSRAINEIVRVSLVRELRNITGNLSSSIANDFSLTAGSNLISNQSSWLDGVMGTLKSEIMTALTGAISSQGKNVGKGVGGLLSSLALMIPHPVAKVVLSILPGIVGALFDGFVQKKEEDNLRSLIVNDVIPSVKAQLRPEVSKSLNQVITAMVTVISEQFEMKITEKKIILEQSQLETDEALESLENKKQAIKMALNEINSLADKAIM